MNGLQRMPNSSAVYQAGSDLSTTDRSGSVPIIDVPGPGLKRDYAGMLEYWQMIRRHKGTVVLAALFGVLGGLLLTLPEPRVYQARTTMEIQGLNDEFLNMKNVNPVSENSAYLDTDIQTQVKILQSNLLITRVREKLQARKPAGDALQPSDRLGMWRKALNIRPPARSELWAQALGTASGGVKVRSSGTNRIVEVSCDSTSGQVAADFCNTLTQEYIDQTLEARWKTTEYTGQWLTKQLQDLKVKLERQQEQLQAYARQTGLVFTGEKNDVDGQQSKLVDLQKELSSAQADRITKQSRYEMAASSPAGALLDVLDDSSLKDSQKSLADLEAKLAQLTVTFTSSHAEVRRVQAQIDAIQAALNASRANILTRIQKEYEAAERREALLANAYAAQGRLVSGKAEQTAHYSLLKRDVDATRLLYDTLLQRLKEASIAAALRASNVRVVDAAEQPLSPYKPDISQRATVGLLFGIILGVGFVVLRERADRTLQDPGDVTYHLGIPELGVVPVGELLTAPRSKRRSRSPELPGEAWVPASGESFADRVEMISWRQKNSLLAESFRTTVTSILFSRRNGDRPRVLVLTSASPKEGKTTVVSNLGISLAEINQTVLVIDGDMRRPRLHSVFNVDNDRGLSELLLEKASLDIAKLEDSCAPTCIPGLYVLPSGSARRSASSLLHSPRLPELLTLARKKFDTVIIDTPPMVNLADARVVARFGDALILVVRSGVTTRDAAMLAKSRFADDGIPVLGTILNFWNPKTPGYSYYRYYYAGYYHYYGNGNGDGHGEPPTTDDAAEAPRRSKRGVRLQQQPQLEDSRATRESRM
jgi:succinoglycan biosynthesis transport protein ExoP